MSFALAIALWMIFFVGIAFDAALEGTFDASSGNTTLGTENENRLNSLVDTESVSAKELGVGDFKIAVPLMNVSWISNTLKLLSWDLAFFEGWTNLIRIVFLAITYGTTLMLVRDIGPAIAAVGSFLLETITAAVGLAASGLKALLRVG